MHISTLKSINNNIKTNFSFQHKQKKTIPNIPDTYEDKKPKKEKKESALFGILVVAGTFLLGWYLSKKTPKI